MSHFGTPVTALMPLANRVVVDAAVRERFDLAVVVESGVFTGSARARVAPKSRPDWTHDYRQSAWVGTVNLSACSGLVARDFRFAHFLAVADAALPRNVGQTVVAFPYQLPR